MTTESTPGSRLKDGRQKRNKTKKQCAKDSDVSESTWTKWEYDQSEPRTIATLNKACSAAGITPTYYVRGHKCIADLTPQERDLLINWRGMDQEGCDAVNKIVEILAAQAEK